MASRTWQSGVSGDWTSAAAWGGAVPGGSDSATFSATGLYTVTLFSAASVASLTMAAPGAVFYDAGALSLSGTLFLQAGTLALAYGAINGGTLALSGGIFQAGGGTLDGVAVQGTLDMSRANATLFVRDGLTLSGAGGVGSGSLTLTGGYASVTFLGTQKFDHATVSLGATGSGAGQTGPASLGVAHLATDNAGATLTLGAGLALREAGGQATLLAGGAGPLPPGGLTDTLINKGIITVNVAGSNLTIAGSGAFSNGGTISVSNGATLTVSAAGFINTGTININASTLAFGGTFAAARLGALGTVKLSKSVVSITGTADNTGGTLSLGAGSAIGNALGPVALAGTIIGGTILDAGLGLSFAPGTGVLDGVAYRGQLDLSAAGACVTLTNGAAVSALVGGAGQISLTGAGSTLLLRGSETLDHGTLTIGNATSTASLGTADAWLASSATTATLGAGLAVQQGGALAAIMANASSPFPNFGLYDSLVNQGSIAGAIAGGTLTLGGFGNFINQGAISVSNGDTLLVSATSFANTGTITITGGATALFGGGSVLYGSVPTWSNSGRIVLSNASLVLGGTVTTAQLGSITATTGTISLTGTISNASSTLSLGPTGKLPSLSLAGTIRGGVVTDTGGALMAGTTGAAVLDGVSYRGTLTLGQASAYLRVRNGLSVSGAAQVLGAGSVLAFQGSQVFDHTLLSIGAAGSAASIDVLHDYGVSGGTTLTLGSGMAVTQAGLLAGIGLATDNYADAIINQGTITANVSGGIFSLGGAQFINQGRITVANGDTLALAAAGFSNTGTVAVTNASLSIGGSLTLAGLGTLVLANASVGVAGTLDLSGGTWSIGAGTAMGRLALTGILRGGTIADAGSGLGCAGGATLDGVAYRGTLDLSRPFSTLSLKNGITVTDQTGANPGTMLVTGAGSRLLANGSQTVNRTTINLGSAGTLYLGQTVAPATIDAAAGATLTLGPRTTLNLAGKVAALGDSGLGQFSDGIVNQGVINAASFSSTLTIGASFFTNAGTLSVTQGAGVVLSDVGFSNTGSLFIGAGSNVVIGLYPYYAAPNAGLTVFTNTGTVTLQHGLLQELTAGGLFPAVDIVNAASGVISGNGTMFVPINNAGLIDAQGGVLSLFASLDGAGTLQAEPGAVLDIGADVAPGALVAFGGAGATVQIDHLDQFAGTLSTWTDGETIDLPALQLTSVGISGGTLAISTATQNFRIASTALLGGALSSGRDVWGGSTIQITPQTIAGGPLVLPVSAPSMLFWASRIGDTFQGLTANFNHDSIGNWTTADMLDLTDMSPVSASITVSTMSGASVLALSDGTHSASVTLTGALTKAWFHLTSDGNGGTLLTYHA